MMALYGQTIHGPDGSVSVDNCTTRQVAIEKTVDLAIKSGWRPPKFWQPWLPEWSEDCRAEYQRRQQ